MIIDYDSPTYCDWGTIDGVRRDKAGDDWTTSSCPRLAIAFFATEDQFGRALVARCAQHHPPTREAIDTLNGPYARSPLARYIAFWQVLSRDEFFVLTILAQ